MGWHSYYGDKSKKLPKKGCSKTDDDKNSVTLKLPTKRPDDVEKVKDSLLLERCLDELHEKRGDKKESAFESIIDAFNRRLQHEFIEKMFTTLLYQCLNSIKKGHFMEVRWATQVIGLLAITTGPGEKAQKILKDSVDTISLALRKYPSPLKITSLVQCLAIITFVGGEGPDDVEKSMQIIWQTANPKLGPNVAATKTSPAVITWAISSWSFLLTCMDGWALNPESWKQSMSYFSTLLDSKDKSLRVAAGEALALTFEMGIPEKFCGETEMLNDFSVDRKLMHINGLKDKVLKQVTDLSAEAGGKGISKQGLKNQRNTFQDILEFLEDGRTPEISLKFDGELLKTSTWSQFIQLNFLRRSLERGFSKHMQENEFLHAVFDFTPKKLLPVSDENRISLAEKRMYKSPNSALNKARTQSLNKQRTLSQGKNVGRYAVGFDDE